MPLSPHTINKKFPQHQRVSITPSAKSSNKGYGQSKFKAGASVGSLGGQKPVVYNLERSPAETHLLRRSSQVRRESAIYGIKNALAPSYNPVRRSITSATDIRSKRGDFVVHYNRKLHSQVTIDSKHEDFYKKHGLPLKPKYNPDGRRFSDTSETDQDYNHEEFKKITLELNNRRSVEGRQSNGSADEKRRSSNKSDQYSNWSQSVKQVVGGKKATPDPYIKLKPNVTGESRYHKRRLQSMSVSSKASALKEQPCIVAFLKSIFCCSKGRRSKAVHPNRMGSEPSAESSVIILEPSSTSDATYNSMSSAMTTTETSLAMSEVLFPGRLQQQRISLTVTPSQSTTGTSLY